MKIVAIIPARYQSQRFPGKALAKIGEKPMIEHVYRRVSRVDILDEVIVATDDRQIFDTVKSFGGKVQMTAAHHRSGTDRIAEVARQLSCDLIVNVQGDEPLIKSEMIKTALQPFFTENNLKMSTLKKKTTKTAEINNPNVVKVVSDIKGYALYFSRLPLPYQCKKEAAIYKHIGLYVYSRDFLLEYNQLEPTPLERTESLEQLRVLEHGFKIKVMETTCDTVGVDTPRDLQQVAQKMVKQQML